MNEKYIKVFSNFLQNTTYSSIIVNIIDVCNYNCYYCYNKQPRTNIKLNLNKLY
jgi:molybdenum cofactor biosynthesis enzyme MoaA